MGAILAVATAGLVMTSFLFVFDFCFAHWNGHLNGPRGACQVRHLTNNKWSALLHFYII